MASLIFNWKLVAPESRILKQSSEKLTMDDGSSETCLD